MCLQTLAQYEIHVTDSPLGLGFCYLLCACCVIPFVCIAQYVK